MINVNFELEVCSKKHDDTLSPFRGECKCLGGLVVMTLTQIVRDQDSIPLSDTNVFPYYGICVQQDEIGKRKRKAKEELTKLF